MVCLSTSFRWRASPRSTPDPPRPSGRRWRRRRLALVALLTTLGLSAGGVGPASAATEARSLAAPPAYIPPVADAVITDHFRAPPSPYAAGNRGLDEATRPGAAVVASAAGRVIFAGPVAGSLHVTVLHDDGLRSSSSYLAVILVHVGDEVRQGEPLGLAGTTFHFGVRDPSGAYLDPEALFAGGLGAHLVPGPDEGAAPLDPPTERAAFEALVAAGSRSAGALATRALALGHEAVAVSPTGSLAALAGEVEQWRRQQGRCTPRSAPVPPAGRRRVAILVGGLGSSSDHAAVDQVDTGTLGYDPADVLRFSYRGGRVPADGAGGALATVTARPYGSGDTEVDLHRSAELLLDLIADVTRAAPGVPIDLIAHSQGGVVARLALADAADAGSVPAAIGAVVTLGTPHQGADLATALTAVGTATPAGRAIRSQAQAAGVDLDLTDPAVAQLSQTSAVAAELARPVPGGVHLVSVGASGDLTVPDVRTVAAGADHVTVHLAGPHAHDRLPAAPATTREIGLAIGGAPPTCADLAQGIGDVATSHLIAQTEDALGLALAAPVP